MLSSMTTSATAAIVSFASASSLTSISKRRAKPPTLRAGDRRSDRSCTVAVRSDHEIDEVNHKNLIRRLDVIRLSLNRSRKVESTWIGSTDEHAVLFNMPKSFTKNCKYVGFEPKSSACIPGVVLHVPAIIPRKPWLSATSWRLELSI